MSPLPLFGRTGHPTAVWNPTNISGCVLWLRSDLGITMDGSNRVGTWADQSENENNATQDTDAIKFLWIDDQLDGYPILRSDGVDDSMFIGGIASALSGENKPFTIYIVGKIASDVGADCSWFGMQNTGSAGPLHWGPRLVDSYCARRTDAGSFLSATGTAMTKGSWKIFRVQFGSDGLINLWENATQLITNGNLNSAGTVTFDIALLCNYGQNVSYDYGSMKADFASVIIYDSALSVADDSLVKGYLQNKYPSLTT